MVGLSWVLPNVKDEPRPWPARRVPNYDLGSEVSLRKPFDSTRRDGHGRWLWRLVGPFFSSDGMTSVECLRGKPAPHLLCDFELDLQPDHEPPPKTALPSFFFVTRTRFAANRTPCFFLHFRTLWNDRSHGVCFRPNVRGQPRRLGAVGCADLLGRLSWKRLDLGDTAFRCVEVKGWDPVCGHSDGLISRADAQYAF